jgi:hypothetical protein
MSSAREPATARNPAQNIAMLTRRSRPGEKVPRSATTGHTDL